jgi:hypothetical protein
VDQTEVTEVGRDGDPSVTEQVNLLPTEGGLYRQALWTHFYSSQVRIPSAVPADAGGISLRADRLKKVSVVLSSRKQTFLPTDILLRQHSVGR